MRLALRLVARLAALCVRRPAALAPGHTSLFARELVRGAGRVRGLSALPGDLAHELPVHRREAAGPLGLPLAALGMMRRRTVRSELMLLRMGRLG